MDHVVDRMWWASRGTQLVRRILKFWNTRAVLSNVKCLRFLLQLPFWARPMCVTGVGRPRFLNGPYKKKSSYVSSGDRKDHRMLPLNETTWSAGRALWKKNCFTRTSPRTQPFRMFDKKKPSQYLVSILCDHFYNSYRFSFDCACNLSLLLYVKRILLIL